MYPQFVLHVSRILGKSRQRGRLVPDGLWHGSIQQVYRLGHSLVEDRHAGPGVAISIDRLRLLTAFLVRCDNGCKVDG